jgi:NAD(P)-dependent dehydrogenase (short-subunit alcohol dehydrogenase family)
MTAATRPVAVVTGGARGIGLGIAEVLYKKGFAVSIWDIDTALLQEATESMASLGDEFECHQVDVVDPAQIEAATSEVNEKFGPIQGLVTCPVLVRRDRLEDMSLDDWNATLTVGLTGVFLTCQGVGRTMLDRRKGSIVNIASVAATHPQPLLGSYSACKAGVVALSQQIAVEWGPRGVRCNTVSPGFVRTVTSEAVYAVPELFEARRMLPPLERLGTPHDMGHAAAFLISDDSSYISGVDIIVDGAFSKTIVDNIPSLAPDGSIVPPPISRTTAARI